MKRRGATQIDWAISLGIFILFVTWFFLFMKPSLNVGFGKDNLLYLVESNFESDLSREIDIIPVFIESDRIGQNIPIVFNMSFNMKNYTFQDGSDFIHESGKVFLLANISQNKTLKRIVHGGTYTEEEAYRGLSGDYDWASTSGNLSIQLYESMPFQAYYGQDRKINDANYYVSDQLFIPENHSYNTTSIVAIYHAGSGAINVTNYVFARNSIIDTYFKSTQLDGNYSFTISYNLGNYTNYYSDNGNFGDIDYGVEKENVSYNHTQFIFYTPFDSMGIYMDTDTRIEIENYNDTLIANLSFNVIGTVNQRLIFFDGDYRFAKDQGYSTKYGLRRKIVGLSEDLLDNFNYTFRKKEWNIPSDREFMIFIWNSSNEDYSSGRVPLYRLGTTLPAYSDINSRKIKSSIVNDDGTLLPVLVDIQVW